MSVQEYLRFGQMKMFLRHIYEYQKGIRSLVLCTMCPTCAQLLSERLERQGIDYLIQPVGEEKVNLFFGKRICLETVRAFVDKPLNKLTPEEDFMLGTMLGYDVSIQCERFCRRRAAL